MSTRINIGKSLPQLYQHMVDFERQAAEAAAQAGIADGFSHLLRLRASQINGCAFCVRLHARDAVKAGETADRLAVLPVWRETSYFDAKERAALALTESITQVAEDQIPDAIYAQAAEVLSAEELAAVEWLAVVINAWNRIGLASRYPVKP